MLVDTNVVSYIYKGDSLGKPYLRRLTGQTLFVSFMTVAELYRWPIQNNWGERRKQNLVQFLKNFAVLPYDDGLAWRWAELMGKTCRGHMSFSDAWIAATALHHGIPLVTHNAKHFEQVPGLQLITEG